MTGGTLLCPIKSEGELSVSLRSPVEFHQRLSRLALQKALQDLLSGHRWSLQLHSTCIAYVSLVLNSTLCFIYTVLWRGHRLDVRDVCKVQVSSVVALSFKQLIVQKLV